jgi:hypothetical protein
MGFQTRATYARCTHTPTCDYSKRGECTARQAKDRKWVKRVVSSGQVPHLWFHKAQYSARNSNHSFYFEGDTIFSWGSHFPIATHVTRGKKNAVLFTEKNYSVSTSGHKSATRSAIPEGTTVFHVEDVFTHGSYASNAHAVNLKSYVERVERHLAKCARARGSYAKQWEHERAASLRQEAREYATFFKLSLPKIAPIPALDSDGLARIKSSEAQKSAEKAAREKARKAELAQQEAEALAKWRAHEIQTCSFYNSPIALRLTKDKSELETSRGARIPVSHALRGLRFVREVVKRGEAFQTNGHKFPLGVYQIDRIETDGTVKAGCHVITLAEIERIAPEIEALAVA